MPRRGLFIDTNLLLLFTVGRVGKQYIAKHGRLNTLSEQDFDQLFRLLRREDVVYVTPNVLTETSNLLAQHGEPERSRFLIMLHHIIQESHEIFVASNVASGRREFILHGLTDAALLESVSEETPLLTMDHALFSAAFAKGEETAVYFPALRSI